MIDTQQQHINLNICGEISIIVVQAHSGMKKRYMHINVHTLTHIYMRCINHNCYLYMPSWGPDLVNKLILFYYMCHVSVDWCNQKTASLYTYQSHIYMRGGWERTYTYLSGDSSPICKRHLESMLKGIKSYLCLVQTGHVDVKGILFGTWKGIRAFG
jgi:hypothetical protein